MHGEGISKKKNKIREYYIDDTNKCRNQAREFERVRHLVVYTNQGNTVWHLILTIG